MGDTEVDDVSTSMNQTRFVKYCERLHINPNLVMLKLTLFMIFGASAALLPFATIHMQSIGLTVEEIAIIYLALPLTTFLAPPVTGLLVDKSGNFKLILILCLVCNAAFHQSLMLIPQMEIPGKVPGAYVLRHPETGMVEVWWSPCSSRECPDEEEINLVLEDCEDHCILRNQTNTQTRVILRGIHQSIAVKPPSFVPDSQPCSGSQSSKDLSAPTFGIKPDNLRFHFENKKNSSGLTKRSVNGGNSNLTTEDSEEAALFVLDMHPDLQEAQDNLGIIIESEKNDTGTDFTEHFSKELLIAHGVNYTDLETEDLRCGGFVMATNLTYSTLKELSSDCMLQKCEFRDGGPEVCPPNYKESDDKVFWIYFALRFIATGMQSASVTIMDPIALTMVQQYGGEFGRERLFSTLGMAVFSPLSGFLIDFISRKKGYTDYSAAFYSYSILSGLAALCVLVMPLGAKIPADHLLRDMVKLFRHPNVIIFILFVFALGNCWGYIESYLFLYLKELGAPNYLLGITVTVGTLSSVPFLYGAEGITRRVGHVNLIIIAFFTHSLRLVGYSYIEDPWWCFPFEAMESFSIHLMWVAATTYCSIISPRTLLATLIGILGMSHYSLGRGSGSFVGGILISSYGIRQTFRFFGLGAVICGCIYTLLHFFWLHKYTDKRKKSQASVGADAEKKPETEEDKEEMEEILERMSLMVRFNHRGSLTSLHADQLRGGSRRGSSSSELTRGLLKSPHDTNNIKTGQNPVGTTRSGQPIVKPNKLVGEVKTPQQMRKSALNMNPASQSSSFNDDFRTRSGSILEEDESQDAETRRHKRISKSESEID